MLVLIGSIAAACGSVTLTDQTRRRSDGEIVEAGSIGTTRLRVGDCFDEPAAGTIRVVNGVPCADPHDAQVVARLSVGGDGPWPGTDALIDEVRPGCSEAAASAASALIDVVGAPEVGLSAYVPDAPAWSDGDRNIICWVEAAEGEKLAVDLVPEADA